MGIAENPTLFTPDYHSKPITLLKGPIVSAISLVNKGANKKRFFLFKSEDGPVDNHGFYIDSEGNLSDPAELNKFLPLIKAGPADDAWKTVYCVVAVPGEVDAQKDVWDADTIRDSAHEYLKKSRLINYMHKDLDSVGNLVESAIAPADMKVGEEFIPKGSWFIAIEPHPEMKKMIETGDITGVSVQGSSKREEVNPSDFLEVSMAKGEYDSVVVPRSVTQTDYKIPESKEDMEIPEDTEGPGIFMLQHILGVPETGKFDALTRKAVREWMANKGVPGTPTLATIKLILSEGDKSGEKEKAQPKSEQPSGAEMAPSPQPPDQVQEAAAPRPAGQEEAMKLLKAKGSIYHFNGDNSKTPLWVSELGKDHVIIEFPPTDGGEAATAKVSLDELYKCENPDHHYETLTKDHTNYPASFGGDPYNPVNASMRFPGSPARTGGFAASSYGTHPENLGTQPSDMEPDSSPDALKAALVRAVADGNEILLRHLADDYGISNTNQIYNYPFTQDELWGLVSRYVLGRMGNPPSESMMTQPVYRTDKSIYPDGAGFSMQKVAPFDAHTPTDHSMDKKGAEIGVGSSVKLPNGKFGIISSIDLNRDEVHVEPLPFDGSGKYIVIAANKVERIATDPHRDRQVGFMNSVGGAMVKGVWSGSMGGHDPEAQGKIRYIVRSFGKWARGKQHVAAKKLLERGVVKTPEAANRLAAWLKDQWMHSTHWREGNRGHGVKKSDAPEDLTEEVLSKAFECACHESGMDPDEVMHMFHEDHHDFEDELNNMFGNNEEDDMEKAAGPVTEGLQASLRDLLALHLIIHQGHWVAKGSGFHPLHMLLGSIYEVVGDVIDDVAERMAQLNDAPAGQAVNVAESQLEPLPDGFIDTEEVISAVSERMNQANNTLRAGLGAASSDPVTENMFQDWVGRLEKQIWLLSSNLPMDEGYVPDFAKGSEPSESYNSEDAYDNEDVVDEAPVLKARMCKVCGMKKSKCECDDMKKGAMCKVCGMSKAECTCDHMEKGWMPSGLTQGELDDGDFAWLSDAYKAGKESPTSGRKLPYKIHGKIDSSGWMAAWKAVHGAHGGMDFSGGPSKEKTIKHLWSVKPKGVNATPPEGMEKADSMRGATVADSEGRKWIVVGQEGENVTVVSGKERATVPLSSVKVVRQPFGKADMGMDGAPDMPPKKKPRLMMPPAAPGAQETAPEPESPEMESAEPSAVDKQPGEENAPAEGQGVEGAGSRLARLLAAARKKKAEQTAGENAMTKSASPLTPEKIDRLRETKSFLEGILNDSTDEDTVSDVETPEVDAVEADFYTENTEVEKDVEASHEATEDDMSDSSINMNQIVEAINGLGEEVDDILTRVEDLSTLGSKLDHIGDLAKSLDSTERLDVLEKAVENLTEALGVFTDTLESVDTLNKRLSALESQPGNSTAEAVDTDITDEIAKSAPADMPLFQRTWGSIF